MILNCLGSQKYRNSLLSVSQNADGKTDPYGSEKEAQGVKAGGWACAGWRL